MRVKIYNVSVQLEEVIALERFKPSKINLSTPMCNTIIKARFATNREHTNSTGRVTQRPEKNRHLKRLELDGSSVCLIRTGLINYPDKLASFPHLYNTPLECLCKIGLNNTWL